METALRPGIDWVGAIDWNVRDFHSYATERGTTYNSYLIRDANPAVIDCVKKPFIPEHVERIKRFIDPAKIKYLVCNHAEPDHASGLADLHALCPSAVVVANKKCRETLLEMREAAADWKWHIVKTGDVLDLGERKLAFVEVPLVHWPDSMVAYSPSDKLLFSNDAFGQHIASRCRFADEYGDPNIVFHEAKLYYANIVMLYAKPVEKALNALLGVDLGMIAPAHGLAWRDPGRIAGIVGMYRKWMAGETRPKVLVLYDTMWESTAQLADAILEGADVPGVEAKSIWVRRSGLTQVAAEFIDTACAAVGSATLNNTLMPALAGALTYLSGFKPPHKAGFAFGSYGWALRGGAEAVEEYLRGMNFDLLRPPLKCKARPTPEALAEARAAGGLLAGRALERGKRIESAP